MERTCVPSASAGTRAPQQPRHGLLAAAVTAAAVEVEESPATSDSVVRTQRIKNSIA